MSGGLGGGDGGGLLWIDIRLLSLKSIGLLCGYLTEGAIVMLKRWNATRRPKMFEGHQRWAHDRSGKGVLSDGRTRRRQLDAHKV